MATYTFNSAYIEAHLQNNANELLKQRIVDRLRTRQTDAEMNRQHFETFCWAWKNECLFGRDGVPPCDPYPFVESLSDHPDDQFPQ